MPGAVAATADRVRVAEAFLDLEVVEQPDRHQTLLERGVGAPRPRVKCHRVPPVAARTAGQLPDEGCDLRPAGAERVDPVVFAELEVLSKPTGIGVDRPRRPAEVRPDPEPLRRSRVPGEHRPLLLQTNQQDATDLSARGTGSH